MSQIYFWVWHLPTSMSSDWSQLLEWRARKEHASSSDAELVLLSCAPHVWTVRLSTSYWVAIPQRLTAREECTVLGPGTVVTEVHGSKWYCSGVSPIWSYHWQGRGPLCHQCDPCLSGWDLDNCPVYATLHTIIVDSSLWYDNDCPQCPVSSTLHTMLHHTLPGHSDSPALDLDLWWYCHHSLTLLCCFHLHRPMAENIKSIYSNRSVTVIIFACWLRSLKTKQKFQQKWCWPTQTAWQCLCCSGNHLWRKGSPK